MRERVTAARELNAVLSSLVTSTLPTIRSSKATAVSYAGPWPEDSGYLPQCSIVSWQLLIGPLGFPNATCSSQSGGKAEEGDLAGGKGGEKRGKERRGEGRNEREGEKDRSDRKGDEKKGLEKKGDERKGDERKGDERKGDEKKGDERKGDERKSEKGSGEEGSSRGKGEGTSGGKGREETVGGKEGTGGLLVGGLGREGGLMVGGLGGRGGLSPGVLLSRALVIAQRRRLGGLAGVVGTTHGIHPSTPAALAWETVLGVGACVYELIVRGAGGGRDGGGGGSGGSGERKGKREDGERGVCDLQALVVIYPDFPRRPPLFSLHLLSPTTLSAHQQPLLPSSTAQVTLAPSASYASSHAASHASLLLDGLFSLESEVNMGSMGSATSPPSSYLTPSILYHQLRHLLRGFDMLLSSASDLTSRTQCRSAITQGPPSLPSSSLPSFSLSRQTLFPVALSLPSHSHSRRSLTLVALSLPSLSLSGAPSLSSLSRSRRAHSTVALSLLCALTPVALSLPPPSHLPSLSHSRRALAPVALFPARSHSRRSLAPIALILPSLSHFFALALPSLSLSPAAHSLPSLSHSRHSLTPVALSLPPLSHFRRALTSLAHSVTVALSLPSPTHVARKCRSHVTH
ncbi:unnamed protein product [Closterium sp. Yama58-4]|nr:unnamed protein product [Closterium sp. Yama58-4]